MSKSGNKPIENATEVIERFGGIRPMSSKINVPVTTIQGWKKRNIIPANRRQDLLEAANENDIDLSDLIEGAPSLSSAVEETALETEETSQGDGTGTNSEENGDAGENPVPAFVREEPEERDTDKGADEKAHDSPKTARPAIESSLPPSARAPQRGGAPEFTELALETEKKAITKSAVISLVLVVLGLGLIVALLWPKVEKVDQQGNRLSALEGDLVNVKEQQALFKGLVPEDWAGQLEDLKAQVENARRGAGPAFARAREASGAVLGQHAGTLEDRLKKLESYVDELTESNAVAGVLARIQLMRETVLGQETLDRASQELWALMASRDGAENGEDIEGLLEGARHKSNALAQTFQDVPPEDLKAAAMLLALTQMRESLNRDATPFDDDLQLLRAMIGNDDPELRAALDRLAPVAEEGVLTPGGLSDEFRSLAGDVVVASLKGEDVSISEKAAARMNNLFSVEKDGELVTGTKTQATVSRAQKQLDQGNVSGALDILNTLDAGELAPLSGWMEKAKSTLAAGNAGDMIREAIEMTAGSGYLGGAELLDNGGGLTVIRR